MIRWWLILVMGWLPVPALANCAALLKPLKLSEEEIDALVAFLRTLTSREFPKLRPVGPDCS